MSNPRIRFLYFDGCPLAPQVRKNLIMAIERMRSVVVLGFEEFDLQHPRTPPELKLWGSPTILLNGRDIAGGRPGEACGCRVYDYVHGVPSTAQILQAIDSEIHQ